MGDNFALDFISKLNGIVPDNFLKPILRELQLFVTNYDISAKVTDVVPYKDIFPDFYKIFIVAKKIEGMAESSIKEYHFCLKDFFEHMDKRCEFITTNDIRIYLYNLQKSSNMSNRSLDNRRLVLNSFFNWCYLERYLPRNPCAPIKPIKYTTKPRHPLSEIEMEQLRDACSNDRDKALVEFLYSTGCRVSEISKIKIRDVDFNTNEVVVFGKGSKYRTVYINSRCEYRLKRYLKDRADNSPWLFPISRAPYTSLKPTGIWEILHKLGKTAEIARNVFPHLVRHTMATDGIKRGMPVEEMQQILGHVSMDTTLIYAEICTDNIKHSHHKYVT